jgi:hypothetical protein
LAASAWSSVAAQLDLPLVRLLTHLLALALQM